MRARADNAGRNIRDIYPFHPDDPTGWRLYPDWLLDGGLWNGVGVRPQPTLKLPIDETAEMAFALLPPGEFIMGSQPSEKGRWKDEAQHCVLITQSFCMGVYPVTQGQWRSVMGDNPSYFSGGDCPVEQVNWDDC